MIVSSVIQQCLYEGLSTFANRSRKKMIFPDSTLALTTLTLFFADTYAQWHPRVVPDTRTLDQIYAAAQKETGPLQVFFGGDGRDPCSLITTLHFLLIFQLCSGQSRRWRSVGMGSTIPKCGLEPHRRSVQVPRRSHRPRLFRKYPCRGRCRAPDIAGFPSLESREQAFILQAEEL